MKIRVQEDASVIPRAALIVPNSEWANRLVAEHRNSQAYKVTEYAILLGEGTGALKASKLGSPGRQSGPVRAFDDSLPGKVLSECAIPDLLE